MSLPPGDAQAALAPIEDRALGALYGLAIGDALGMPTQSLPRDVIVARYGEVISGFEAAPADHPLAAGLPAGSVTDDTEQALVLAQVLIDGDGQIDPTLLAERLIAWEASMRARGSADLLGPSTSRALKELLAGVDPSETGRFGTTNGAAMRVTPVGIVAASSDLAAVGRPGRRLVFGHPQHRTRVGRCRGGGGGRQRWAGRRRLRRPRSNWRWPRRTMPPGVGIGSPVPTWPRGSAGRSSWSAAATSWT